jgi:hypothetical protein
MGKPHRVGCFPMVRGGIFRICRIRAGELGSTRSSLGGALWLGCSGFWAEFDVQGRSSTVTQRCRWIAPGTLPDGVAPMR